MIQEIASPSFAIQDKQRKTGISLEISSIMCEAISKKIVGILSADITDEQIKSINSLLDILDRIIDRTTLAIVINTSSDGVIPSTVEETNKFLSIINKAKNG